MKKIYLLTLLACLFSSIMFAQTIQLIMSPNPSPYLSDWQNKTETARLIVNNTSQSSIDCKIKTQLFNGDYELVAETDFAKMPVLTLMPGISQFNAEDIYPLEAVKTYGNYFNSTSATGRIPDGNYRICTDLVDPINGTPLTTQSPQCKMFRIIAYQAPVLIAPRENQIIPETESKGIFFRWTPVSPTPIFIVTYRLQIWEVSDGQTNVDAVRNNWPIIEKDFRGILQTQWPYDFAPPDEGMNYVWAITPLDNEGRNLVDGYGFAEPFGFTIGDFTTGDITYPSIIVKLQQPPPNQLRMTDLSNFTLNNPTEKPIEVSLECRMTSQETKPILIIVIVILKPFTLPLGTTTFTYDDIKTGDIKFESDEWRDIILNTGSIPSGGYNICVSVIDKEGKEIGKDCVEQKIESSACDDFTFQLMDYKKIFTGDSGGVEEIMDYKKIFTGDSGGVEESIMDYKKIYKGDSIAYQCLITNKYNGTDPENKPKSFRIKLSNDLLIVKADEAPKGWTRTPSKFPPGSSSVIWTASSGDIPSDETDLGSIVFINVKSEPILLQYEWLNKNGKVICKDSAIRYDTNNAGTTQSIKLISPTDGENITPEKQLNFIWEPLLLKATEPITYRLKVWQLMEGQSPTQALSVNQPIFTKNVDNMTQIVVNNLFGGDGPCVPPYLCDFIWNVQALNHEGKPIGENNGMAEPFGFKSNGGKAGDPVPNLKLQQPPQNQLRLSDLGNFTLNNPTRKPIEVSLSCQISSAEPRPLLIIVAILLKQYTLPPGTTTFTYDDIKTGDIKFESDEWREAFSPTGKLPAGDYEICVSVIDKEGKEIGKDCVEQKIPIGEIEDLGNTIIKLISPKNGETIMSEKKLQFIWLPPVPVPPDTRCRLKIVEIRGDESSEEAMQNSESFFDVRVELQDQEGEVSYKYPKTAPKFEAGKKYVWMIQCGDLRSSISIFDRWGRK